jgi:hypothetical protein
LKSSTVTKPLDAMFLLSCCRLEVMELKAPMDVPVNFTSHRTAHTCMPVTDPASAMPCAVCCPLAG